MAFGVRNTDDGDLSHVLIKVMINVTINSYSLTPGSKNIPDYDDKNLVVVIRDNVYRFNRYILSRNSVH